MIGALGAPEVDSSLVRISVVRIATVAVWSVIVACTPYEVYSELPRSMARAFGIGKLFADSNATRAFLLNAEVLIALKYSALALGAITLTWPRRCTWVAWAHCLLVVILDATTKSIGAYANHGQEVALLALVTFAVFNRRPYLSWIEVIRSHRVRVDTAPASDDWPDGLLWILRVLVVLPYTFIGLNRLMRGGTDLFLGDALLYCIGALYRSRSSASVHCRMSSH